MPISMNNIPWMIEDGREEIMPAIIPRIPRTRQNRIINWLKVL
jgi:hypothetical protein